MIVGFGFISSDRDEVVAQLALCILLGLVLLVRCL